MPGHAAGIRVLGMGGSDAQSGTVTDHGASYSIDKLLRRTRAHSPGNLSLGLEPARVMDWPSWSSHY